MNYGVLALIHREIARLFRIWRQTFLPPMITSYLYFEIFGKVIGGRIGSIDGIEYVAFIAPGLVMMNVVMNSYTNSSFSVFAEKFHKGFSELLSAPLSDNDIILGFIVGSICRSFVSAGLIVGIGYFFTDFPNLHLLAFIAVIFSSSLVMSLLGLIFGFYAKDFDDTSFVPTFFLTPMTFLGGIFFPVSDFGGFWGMVAQYNPIAGVCTVYRSVMLGVPMTHAWEVYCMLWLVIACLLWMYARFIMVRSHIIRT